MDVYEIMEDVADDYGPRITAALRTEAKASGLKRRSGKLFGGFKHKVRKNSLEVWGLSFSLPRYGYIQNAGIQAGKRIALPGGNGSYSHPGTPGRGFIQSAMDPLVDQMFDEIQERTGDAVVRQIRF